MQATEREPWHVTFLTKPDASRQAEALFVTFHNRGCEARAVQSTKTMLKHGLGEFGGKPSWAVPGNVEVAIARLGRCEDGDSRKPIIVESAGDPSRTTGETQAQGSFCEFYRIAILSVADLHSDNTADFRIISVAFQDMLTPLPKKRKRTATARPGRWLTLFHFAIVEDEVQ